MKLLVKFIFYFQQTTASEIGFSVICIGQGALWLLRTLSIDRDDFTFASTIKKKQKKPNVDKRISNLKK